MWDKINTFVPTFVGLLKSGNGLPPSDGKTDTEIRIITVNGINNARHRAMASCFVNLGLKNKTKSLKYLEVLTLSIP